MEEQVGESRLFVSEVHKFGTDAFLLAHFAAPKSRYIACDLGTGCGIIPLLWQNMGTGPAVAYGLDIQPDAIALLEQTVNANGFTGKILPVLQDLRQITSKTQALPIGRCNLVTCNPPYFTQGSGYYSPTAQRLTARHETHCDFAQVCTAATTLLKYGGELCICHRPQRLPDVLVALRAAGLEPKILRFVQHRHDKAPWLFLCKAKLGAKPDLQVQPPLIMEDAHGGLTPELLAIYGKTVPKQPATHQPKLEL